MKQEHTTAEFLFSVLREIAIRASMGAAYATSWGSDFALKEVTEAWTDKETTMRHARNRRVTVAELQAMPVDTLRELGFSAWDEKLTVIPLWAWNYLADGEKLTCIDGSQVVKGEAEIDLDVRGGCIAFGFAIPAALAA